VGEKRHSFGVTTGNTIFKNRKEAKKPEKRNIRTETEGSRGLMPGSNLEIFGDSRPSHALFALQNVENATKKKKDDRIKKAKTVQRRLSGEGN